MAYEGETSKETYIIDWSIRGTLDESFLLEEAGHERFWNALPREVAEPLLDCVASVQSAPNGRSRHDRETLIRTYSVVWIVRRHRPALPDRSCKRPTFWLDLAGC